MLTDTEKLTQPKDFYCVHHLGESYTMPRHYAAAFPGIVIFPAALAAQNMLHTIEVIRILNTNNWNTVCLDRV